MPSCCVCGHWAQPLAAVTDAGAVLAPLKRADDDFPSLAVTKNVKESKKAKQKQQKMSLTDFMKTAGRPVGGRQGIPACGIRHQGLGGAGGEHEQVICATGLLGRSLAAWVACPWLPADQKKLRGLQ